MVKRFEVENEEVVMVTVGDEHDDCPICIAARSGKSPAEIVEMVQRGGLEMPEGASVVVLEGEPALRALLELLGGR